MHVLSIPWSQNLKRVRGSGFGLHEHLNCPTIQSEQNFLISLSYPEKEIWSQFPPLAQLFKLFINSYLTLSLVSVIFDQQIDATPSISKLWCYKSTLYWCILHLYWYKYTLTCVTGGLQLYGMVKTVQSGSIDCFILLFIDISAHSHSILKTITIEATGPCW